MRKSLMIGFVVLLSVSGLMVTGIAQTRTPVVLLPGYGGIRLLTTLQGQTVAPRCPSSGIFKSWVCCDQPSAFSPACRDRLMTLVYNRQLFMPMSQRFSEQPGVTVTIEDYGNIESAPGYMSFFTFLEGYGYTPNLNLRVAGYDWRLTSDIGFLQRTTQLIGKTYSDNGNIPVHLVGHSNRPFHALYLLTHTSQAWKNKYIHGFTPIAGNWPGQGSMYSFLFTGFNVNDLVYPADAASATISALMFQSHPDTYMSAADPAVFKNQGAVIQAASVIYTPQHYRKLFRDARMVLAQEIGPYCIGFVPFQQPPYFPNVDVYAELGGCAPKRLSEAANLPCNKV